MDQPSLKPGYATTEFWVTVFSAVAAIAAQFFHKDLGPYVQSWAVAATAIVGFGYAISRGQVKAAHTSAIAEIASSRAYAEAQAAPQVPIISTEDVADKVVERINEQSATAVKLARKTAARPR